MHLRLLPLAAVMSLCFCGPSHALEAVINGATIGLPEGWKQGSERNQFIREFGQYKAIVTLLGPSFEEAALFDKNFETVSKSIGALAEEKPYGEYRGVTTSGHQLRTEVRCCSDIQGVRIGQELAGFASANVQAFLMLSELGSGKDEEKDKVDAEFDLIVRNLRMLAQDKPFAVAPRAGDGGLEGVFTTVKTGIRPNAFGGTDYYADSRIIQFDPSGVYTDALPVDGQSVAQHCTAKPEDCGLYALKGGGVLSSPSQIEMVDFYENGMMEIDTVTFARDGQDLSIDGNFYGRIPPFASGHRFDGTWQYLYAQSGTNAWVTGSVSIRRVLRLNSDGTFERSGWTGMTSSDNNIGISQQTDENVSSGSYSVDGYTLTLMPKGAAPEKHSIYASDAGKDSMLIISGNNYLKQE